MARIESVVDTRSREFLANAAQWQILIDDVPGPFLYNNAATFVVNPAFTGYTPTASEVEWPGYLGSPMTIDLVEE